LRSNQPWQGTAQPSGTVRDESGAAGSFGRITSQAGEPRVLQFGVKYDF
jgi:hypothetical protein